MSAIAFNSQSSPALSLLRLLKPIRDAEPRFFALGVAMLFAMAPTGFAALVDARNFLGADVWLKPLKFEAALFVYLVTLAFFARWLPAGTTDKRWYRVYGTAVVLAIVVEMAWIGGAAALGTASHFNTSLAGQIIYPAMGVAAVLLTTPTAVYAWQISRNPTTGLSPALKEAVVLGLGLVLPLTLITAGTMSSMGGHAIGGSGLHGLPVMGWARDGGDLRVAHFFATHAMHFVPVFGLISVALLGPVNWWPIWLFTAAFVGFVGWTFARALMGTPFLPWLG